MCTSSTNDSPSQTSPSFSYAYDATSSPPFKIYTKSTITQVSSSTATIPLISWSNPPPLIHSHLLSRLPNYDDGTLTRINSAAATAPVARDMDDELLQEMTAAIKVSSLTPSLDHHYHQLQYDDDNPLPRNAKALYHSNDLSSPTSAFMLSTSPNPASYLSSSVPSSAQKISAIVTNIHHRHHSEDGYNNDETSPIQRRGSTNSSPLARSRRQSIVHREQPPTFDASDDGQKPLHRKRRRGTVKTLRRWLKHGNRVILTRICLLLAAADDLVVVLLFPDEVKKRKARVF